MKTLVLSKYGMSTNEMYEGVHLALKKSKTPFVDINIIAERYGKNIRRSPRSILFMKKSSIHLRKNDKIILKKIQKFQPSIILITHAEGLHFLFDNFQEIKKTKAKVAYWLCDLAYQIFPNKKLGKMLDFIFLTNAGQISMYQKKWGVKKIIFLPQGFISYPPGYRKKSRTEDIVFLGRRYTGDSRYDYRNQFLNKIKGRYDYTERDDILPQEMSEYLSNFKIVLGINWKNDIELYSSDRLFLVLGSGGFHLTHYVPKLEKMFENKKHLVWFKNLDEAKEMINYYLKNNREREEIAKNGYDLAMRFHTYECRLKNIFDIINQKTDKFYGFLNENCSNITN